MQFYKKIPESADVYFAGDLYFQVAAVPFPASINLSFHLAFCFFFFPKPRSAVLGFSQSYGICGQPLSGLTGPASSRSSVKQPALIIPVHVSTASQLGDIWEGW